MTVRRASALLQSVKPVAPLLEREASAADPEWSALAWQGDVRLDPERAVGVSAPAWQHHVRTGLFERLLSLGRDHWDGSHGDRTEVGTRVLAHIDALAEAGMSLDGIAAFAEEAELEHPGEWWTIALLYGCIDVNGADEAFEAWIASLDPASFVTYRPVLEIARAVAVAPSAAIRDRVARWTTDGREVLAAISIEATPLDSISAEKLRVAARSEAPFVHAAAERLFARLPPDVPRPAWQRPSWIDVPVPALSFEVARARLLSRDVEPLALVRQLHARTREALGPYVLEVLALAGDGSDEALALDLARGFPSTDRLLDSMGRLGLPALLPRLMADLAGDDHEDAAHGALTTMLGPRVLRPSVAAWEGVLATLEKPAQATRLRGGLAYTPSAVLEEMKRPEHSARDLEVRAHELFVRLGRVQAIDWDAFGVSLAGALSELSHLMA
jgi:hypothetical protein